VPVSVAWKGTPGWPFGNPPGAICRANPTTAEADLVGSATLVACTVTLAGKEAHLVPHKTADDPLLVGLMLNKTATAATIVTLAEADLVGSAMFCCHGHFRRRRHTRRRDVQSAGGDCTARRTGAASAAHGPDHGGMLGCVASRSMRYMARIRRESRERMKSRFANSSIPSLKKRTTSQPTEVPIRAHNAIAIGQAKGVHSEWGPCTPSLEHRVGSLAAWRESQHWDRTIVWRTYAK
jgi:hypothetical protein